MEIVCQGGGVSLFHHRQNFTKFCYHFYGQKRPERKIVSCLKSFSWRASTKGIHHFSSSFFFIGEGGGGGGRRGDTPYLGNIPRKNRSSWLNCAFRDDEAVSWVIQDTMRRQQLVIDFTGSVERVSIPLYIAQSGDLVMCY